MLCAILTSQIKKKLDAQRILLTRFNAPEKEDKISAEICSSNVRICAVDTYETLRVHSDEDENAERGEEGIMIRDGHGEADDAEVCGLMRICGSVAEDKICMRIVGKKNKVKNRTKLAQNGSKYDKNG